MASRILAIDDDLDVCELLEAALSKAGHQVESRSNAEEAMQLSMQADYDVVVTDLNLADMSGLELCRRLTLNRPDIPVIMITAFGSMESAIDAIRAGVYDFINKPIEMRALVHTIERAIEDRRLREEVKLLREAVAKTGAVGDLIGKSAPMQRVYDLIRRLGDADASVLITGESGTGKELVARALHAQSRRSNKRFVAINCVAVPEQLLESELFGHVRGAFTDAHNKRRGLFEQADGGTLLLDEVGEMSPEMQAKLLRVLQERKVHPVGSDAEYAFNVRVIAATNRDLEEDVEQGRFREDLYYRLNVVQIHMPPLRARGNDILLLAQHFIDGMVEQTHKPVRGISAAVAQKLLEFDWPGNVRQLQNCMERAVTLTRFEEISVEDLPERIRNYQGSRMPEPDAEHVLTLDQVERRYIERVLKLMNGNKTQSARVLGLDRRTLYRKLERYDAEEKLASAE